jgi:Family of unknown function (DUF5677)
MKDDKKIITERYFEAINICNLKLFEEVKEDFENVKPIYPFVEFIIERLCTVTSLTIQNLVWDAEIVYRCALETFIKFIFITSVDQDEQAVRLREFWTDLAEIRSIKLSEQAQKSLKLFSEYEAARLAYSPLILSHEEEARLKTKWPRVKRQQLEQKWSFSEIIPTLAKNYRGNPLEAFIGFAYSYRMASHVSHGDETGILIIRERESRPVKEKDIANFAHYIRLLSDSFIFSIWTAVETLSFLEKDVKFFLDLQKSMEDIHIITDKYQLKVFDDPLYNKFRG